MQYNNNNKKIYIITDLYKISEKSSRLLSELHMYCLLFNNTVSCFA